MAESSLKSLLGLAVGLLLVGGTAWAIYMRFAVIAPRLQKIQHELLAPYLALQAEGKLAEAYERYTTPAYRHRFPLEKYLEHHRESQAKWGRRLSLEVQQDTSPFFENESSSYLIYYLFQFEKAPVMVAFEIVPGPAGYRIQSAHTEGAGDSLWAAPW